jgi:L-rhamnose mutarotase
MYDTRCTMHDRHTQMKPVARSPSRRRGWQAAVDVVVEREQQQEHELRIE